MEQTYQAVIYSVENPVNEVIIFGKVIGPYGSECSFPKGYKNFNIVDVSDFMSLENTYNWVKETTETLQLKEHPRELSDFCEETAA